MCKIRIGLVEDQFLFRKGMKAILASQPGFEVIFESADGYSVLDKLEQSEIVPDVMLVDLSLPPNGTSEYSGKDLTIVLRKKYPQIRIIILSAHDDEHFIAQLIECGAHGYLVKDSDPNEVCEAIMLAHTKGSYINERTLKAIQFGLTKKTITESILPAPLDELTKREEEVLQLICMQHTTEEIAEILFISPKTVNGHRISLLQKTGANNVVGLAMFAIKSGIVKV